MDGGEEGKEKDIEGSPNLRYYPGTCLGKQNNHEKS
jgi:hypothetical protein